MSYKASGKGYITFSSEVETDTLTAFVSMLAEHFDDLESECAVKEAGHPDRGCAVISVGCGPDQSYHEAELSKALAEIAQAAKAVGSQIKEGEIEYIGQDDEYWHLIYRDGGWHEECGRVEYEAVSAREVIDAFVAYVSNDLAVAEPGYVRDVLTDVCGLSSNQLRAIGLDYLFDFVD